MAQPNNWEADKMLDVYIHDYLVKRNLKASAKAFQEEGKVSSEPVAIDAPGGFLFEWWSVFWDIFIARTNEKHSEVAASYIETQSLKARERYQQQQMSQQQQQQQMQMQQMLLRQQQQQQQQQQQRSREGGPLLNGSPNGLMNNNSLIRQNQGTANAMAAKIYEECLKLPPKDSVDEGAVKGFGDNVSQLLNQNNMLKNANSTGQPSGSVLHSTAGLSAGLQQVQIGSQQLPVATQDIKTEMNTVLGQSSGTSEGFLFGASGTAHSKPNLLSPGTSQEGSNPPLRGWPLTGIDPLRSSLLQPQKSFMQSSQQYNLQMLPPQQQQRLLMQVQANSNLNDVDSRRIQMLLNRSAIANKDGQPNAIGDVTQKVGSSLSPMARPDMEMLLKMKMAHVQLLQQQQQQQQRQQLQHEEGNNLQQPQQEALSNQHSQVTSHQQQQDDKVGVANGTDGSVSNSFRGNEQGASKSQNGRKRKRPGSSSGPANSSGTANTAGPSLSSPPSTPSNQTSGDVMNMAGNLQHSGSSSNPLTMYASEGQGILASPSNPLADIDRFVDDGSLEDNVESFFVA